MAQIYVKYNPYRLQTVLMADGREISADSSLYKITKGKRLQEWIGAFPRMLREELATADFLLEFCGMELDWDDFEDAFEQAQQCGLIRISGMRYIAGKSDEDINDKIVDIFHDLQDGPVEDFRDEKLRRAFESINNSIFPVNVIATMSSGKSTLINAFLGSRLMPYKNEACTATITEILDNDKSCFSAVVFDENGEVLEEISELSYERMMALNENESVSKIAAEGNIPFLDSRSTALMLVDTPGPNNAQNQEHKNTTYRAINNDSNNMILYVLNSTQLGTNDDSALLRYVADQIKKGGKQVRDRFLFVINKMDQFNPEEENIENVLRSAKDYLTGYGIENPQLYPCSAFAALNLRTTLRDVDIDSLTREQERRLPQAAKDALPMIDKSIAYKSMHLEEYTTLVPSAQRELNYRLSKAIEREDRKEQALIHSGICSIEAAITAYVKKYAKTKKVKDLVETFEEVLESSQVLARAKNQIANDEEAARACTARSAAVQKIIADGNEAKAFRERIEALNPLPVIEKKAAQLKEQAHAQAARVFKAYGDSITSREEAKRLVKQFSINSSDAMAELTAELESAINQEIVDTGERLLMEYQEKLSRVDDASPADQLDFNTVDLLKGALQTMRENAASLTSDEFAADTVENIGETTYESYTYYEKVGQEEVEEIAGSHEEKIGTRKVKSGSHREKVGTRQVRNPAKRWWKIFTPKYIEEDVYETVDDYKDEDVYETVLDYRTVLRDVFEERTRQIEKFHVQTADIQSALISKMRMALDDGIDDALKFAEKQIHETKEQFFKLFVELDKLIVEKYKELEACAADQNEKEARLQENKAILDWIEACQAEIAHILDV